MSELPIKRSDNFGQLVGALALAQQNFGSLVKTHVNTYTGKKYADLADVIAATQPSLSKNGVSVVQVPIRKDDAQEAGVLTILAHSSGEWISVELILPATMKAKDGVTKFDQQSIGSAITYARRYTWQALVGVAAEEDDDGNDATDRTDPRVDAPKPKPVQKPAPVNQNRASTGGERPNDSKVPRAVLAVTTVPALPAEPVIITQSAPQTGDFTLNAPSVVPQAAIPPFEPDTTPVESTTSDLPKLASSEKPNKTQFDVYVKRAGELRTVLEKNGLKASKGITSGAKLKNYLLATTGVKDLSDLAIYQWEDFFIQTDQTDPVQLVTLIEGGKAA